MWRFLTDSPCDTGWSDTDRQRRWRLLQRRAAQDYRLDNHHRRHIPRALDRRTDTPPQEITQCKQEARLNERSRVS